MRELNFIENKGRFGITFMSDDIAEANTVMNAVQRFISKKSSKEAEENTLKEELKEEIDNEREINNEKENKSFEEALKENNEIMEFGEDASNYRTDDEEDPLSADEDNINKWDFDSDGNKVDTEGNKFLFDN